MHEFHFQPDGTQDQPREMDIRSAFFEAGFNLRLRKPLGDPLEEGDQPIFTKDTPHAQPSADQGIASILGRKFLGNYKWVRQLAYVTRWSGEPKCYTKLSNRPWMTFEPIKIRITNSTTSRQLQCAKICSLCTA